MDVEILARHPDCGKEKDGEHPISLLFLVANEYAGVFVLNFKWTPFGFQMATY
ncbi:hypothetical protein [Rhizobium vallis]|uniref:hypothetical protein n=1 Tax=Rhizobium vallis TaxID=634290 RepID=UPI0013E019B9|nr:hypothetical protein [Rhizobium vallis]